MARPKKVVDSTESTTVKTVKDITNPCDGCKKTYDRKKSFCKSCVNYRG